MQPPEDRLEIQVEEADDEERSDQEEAKYSQSRFERAKALGLLQHILVGHGVARVLRSSRTLGHFIRGKRKKHSSVYRQKMISETGEERDNRRTERDEEEQVGPGTR